MMSTIRILDHATESSAVPHELIHVSIMLTAVSLLMIPALISAGAYHDLVKNIKNV
jgi:hypothetical protein